MANVYPSHFYRDPAEGGAEGLRRYEKRVVGSCNTCQLTVGEYWGEWICGSGHKRDEDGHCPKRRPIEGY